MDSTLRRGIGVFLAIGAAIVVALMILAFYKS